MRLKLFNRFRFSEIRKDRWQESIKQLSREESSSLRVREFFYYIYVTLRFIVLLPFSILKSIVHLFIFLGELERLHFSPLRKVHHGRDCAIDKQTWLANGHNITLGDFVKISAFSSIMAGRVSTITIGSNTIVAPGVTMVSFNHGTRVNGTPIRYQEWDDLMEDSIVLGEDVWIGANVVILPGTSIGKGSIIGAGTVVKGSIPPETVCYSKDGQLKMVSRK
jgi:acetyltransferase-like isoleucine patch superfamily enzyme